MPLTHTEHKFLSWRRSFTTGLWRLLGMRSWLSLPRNFCKAASKQNLRYCLKVGIAAVLAYLWALWTDMHFTIWAPMSACTQGLFRNYGDAKVMQIFAFYNALCHVAQAVSLMQERMEPERSEQASVVQGAV